MAQKRLEVVMKGVDQLTPMLKSGALSAETFKRKLEELNKAGKAPGMPSNNKTGFLASLKAQTGEESELGQIVKMAKGAGAVAAVSMIGNLLDDITLKVKDFAHGIRDGSKDISSATADLTKSLPVIGGFARAIENVLDEMTGWAADKERAGFRTKLGDLATVQSAGMAKSWKTLDQAAGKELRALYGQQREAYRDGFAGEVDRAFTSAQAHQADLADRMQAELDKLDEEQKARADEIRKAATNTAGTIDPTKRKDMQDALDASKGKAELERQKIQQRYATLSQAQAETDGAKYRRLLVDNQKAASDKLEAMQLAHNDKAAQIRAEGLRMLGHDLQAEQTLIDATAAKKKAELDREIQEGQKAYAPGAIDWGKYRAKRMHEINAEAEQARAKAQQQDDRTQQADQLSANNKVLAAQIALAQAKGAQDRASREQLSLVRAWQSVLAEMQNAHGVLSDPRASVAAKHAAAMALRAKGEEAAWQYQNELNPPVPEKRLAALQEGSTLTGVAQMSMERDNVQQRLVKASEDAIKLQAAIAKNTAELLQYLKQQPPQQIIFGR